MKARLFVFAAAAMFAAQLVTADAAQARDQVRVVGSSTVYPFATTVAEHFGKTSGFKSPVVESIGTGGGFKLFCSSLDAASPDIAMASRHIRPSETAACAAHDIKEITEITIGFDGMVIANARSEKPLHLTHRQLFLAIAKTVPLNGKLIANPYQRWRDIDASLPDEKILVFGPAPNHGTRDSLVELAMTQTCHEYSAVQAAAPAQQDNICAAVREDGAFVDVSQNYSISLQKMIMEPHAVGILPFSYFDQNRDKIQAATIDGKEATYDQIFSGQYPLSRPLFLYVKNAHLAITAGLRDFLADFTSEKAWSKDGYLSERGLIALPDDQRHQEAEKAKELLKTAH
jgi:phosphate transport system substrate-binding protein